MRFFPKNAKRSITKLRNNFRISKTRYKQDGQEPCFNIKVEFDQIVDETYTGISVEDRKNLWRKIGSQLLSQTSAITTKDRLKTILIQAHKNSPI